MIQDERRAGIGLHLALLAGLYGLTRSARLLLLPVFSDEALYIRWATLIREDPASLFLPAMDGKTPLFMWINSLTLGLIGDVLLSGRIISAVGGIFTVVGIYFIGKKLYSPGVGFLSAFIYLLLPLSLLHDRLALADSLLTAFATGLMLISICFVRHPKGVYGIALGVTMGLGFLAKTPMLIFFIYPILAVFLFSDCKNVRLWIGLAVAYGVALILMAPYLLHKPPMPAHGMDKLLHNVKITEVIVDTLKLQNTRLFSSTAKWADYLLTYVTWPLLLIFLGSVLQGIKNRDLRTVYFLSWFLLPSLVIVFLAKEHYSRYFLFCIPPVALMVAHAVSGIFEVMREKLRQWPGILRPVISCVMVAVLLFPAVHLSFNIIYAPDKAEMVKSDRWQYTDSEFSGYGIHEAVEFLSAAAKEKPVVVFFAPTWGNPTDSLYLYLKDRPNIRMYDAWWVLIMPIFPADVDSMPVYKSRYRKEVAGDLVLADLRDQDVFFIARDNDAPPEVMAQANPNLDRIRSFKKLATNYSFSIYRLNHSLKVYMPR